ncbi:Uncharacterized membrane protein YdcZ, DUF606 family [Clostridium cavendishii DSM 21758]|uniref:Uncharacterized membrane protein YdcZ, DUF606 family n=1 Tax=Clostridium cavendishii DSM 21758 TaxID=1121302 RepID=A0A1M6FMF7_9CLOT|nr:DMT family transporter [Clostridium cavendishii]SHI98799.1 Uncharacterized membrane protein YdcZ, DUF606 family [Clostridium cavendishii DSM 21758]
MFMVILAVIGGILTTLSMIINSSLGKRIGVFQATLVNYFVGLVTTSIVVIFIGNKMQLSLNDFSKMPFYIFLGGVVGVSVVYSSNRIVPKIPVVYSTLLFFIGQIVAGIIIDYILLKTVSTNKIIGAIIITIGILYNSRVDKKITSKQ